MQTKQPSESQYNGMGSRINQKACKEMIKGHPEDNDLKSLLNHGTNDCEVKNKRKYWNLWQKKYFYAIH